VLDCKIGYALDYEWMNISHQLCSIMYKCHLTSLTLKLSIQIAGIDIKETYSIEFSCVTQYICVPATNSDESVAKGLVVQGSESTITQPSTVMGFNLINYFLCDSSIEVIHNNVCTSRCKRSKYVLPRPPLALVTTTVCPLKENVMFVEGSC